MAAVRKIKVDSRAGVVSAAAARTGAAATFSVLSPACAVEQIEQAWWEVVEFSGCACTACTMPIVHTNSIASMQTTLPKTLWFGDEFIMPGCRELDPFALQMILPLDGHLGK